MYTYEVDPAGGAVSILDPDGDYICSVTSVSDAEALLSHLNR